MSVVSHCTCKCIVSDRFTAQRCKQDAKQSTVTTFTHKSDAWSPGLCQKKTNNTLFMETTVFGGKHKDVCSYFI